MIADFGYSIHNNKRKRETLCGTVEYLPPEMVKGVLSTNSVEKYDEKVDIWALGVLLFELCAGVSPFSGEDGDGDNTKRRIDKGSFEYPDKFSDELKELLSSILRKNPKERITLDQILESEWIKKNQISFRELKGTSFFVNKK